MKVEEIKRPPKLTVHTKIQLFFLLTFSLEFCKSLVNFQRSEKVDSYNVLPVLSLFLWRRNF